MTPEDLVKRVPRLFHMAQDGSWESIRQRGLLSTTALLDLYELAGANRAAIESRRRPKSVTIFHPTHGSAVIRDNKPMSDAALARCLKGMTPQSWYELLNARCFFWCTEDRLSSMLNARPYRDLVHAVLVVDTAVLVDRYRGQLELSTINTGATLYRPPERGPDTFRSLADFPSHATPAELVIPYSVPDVADLVLQVSRQKGDVVVESEVRDHVSGVVAERA